MIICMTVSYTMYVLCFQLSALPLPPDIIRGMHCLCLNDFLIDPNEVTAEHHKDSIFPAKCLIDGTSVFLQVCSRGMCNFHTI